MEFLADISKQSHCSPKTSLEDLPSEIKVMILCHIPKLASLSSIVHASPAYHQAYLGAREEVLHAITVRTLQKHDIGLLDPWTAVNAPQLSYDIPHRVEIIHEYLERYAQGQMDASRRRLTSIDSLTILSLQRKFTILITKYYLGIFARNPFQGLTDNDAPPPSNSELHRLHRALWRYEIYSKLFGPIKQAPRRELSMYGDVLPGSTFSEVEIAHHFFRLFPIHEVEELACLQKWAGDYYSQNPPVRHGAQLVALGPEKLYQVMTAASETERRSRISQNDKPKPGATMRAALDAYERDVNRGSWQWKGMDDRSNSERAPNTGWLWASGRGVQNIDFRLRRWGYVFWDQERLDHWDITEDNMVNWPRPRQSCGFLVCSSG